VPSPSFELLLLAMTLGVVVVVIVIRVRSDLHRQRDGEPSVVTPAAKAAPASFHEPPDGLVRVTGGVDATTAESIVQDLLAAGLPAIAKLDHVVETHNRHGPTSSYRASVLVPAATEQQALDVVMRRLKQREKEGDASDAEVERAFHEDEEADAGVPAASRAGHVSRIPAVLLALLLLACALYALAKVLR
jgi:hypothetical protein